MALECSRYLQYSVWVSVNKILKVLMYLIGVLFSLGKMRVLWETMNEDTKRILLSGIERKSVEMNERDISNILYRYLLFLS
jgi:hypothetical protein